MGQSLHSGSKLIASLFYNITNSSDINMVVNGSAADIMVTNCFTGVNANFLRPSIIENGLDPNGLQKPAGGEINIDGGGHNAKAWKEIWSAGQGIGAVKRTEPAGDFLDRLALEYQAAKTATGMGA